MSKRLFMFAVKGRTRRPFTANVVTALCSLVVKIMTTRALVF